VSVCSHALENSFLFWKFNFILKMNEKVRARTQVLNAYTFMNVSGGNRVSASPGNTESHERSAPLSSCVCVFRNMRSAPFDWPLRTAYCTATVHIMCVCVCVTCVYSVCVCVCVRGGGGGYIYIYIYIFICIYEYKYIVIYIYIYIYIYK